MAEGKMTAKNKLGIHVIMCTYLVVSWIWLVNTHLCAAEAQDTALL